MAKCVLWENKFQQCYPDMSILILLHLEWPKLYGVLAIISAIRLKVGSWTKTKILVTKLFCLFLHAIKYSCFSESVVTEKTVGFVESCRFSLVQFLNVLELRY